MGPHSEALFKDLVRVAFSLREAGKTRDPCDHTVFETKKQKDPGDHSYQLPHHRSKEGQYLTWLPSPGLWLVP